MASVLIRVVLVLVTCYAGLCFALWALQDSLIYFPVERSGPPGSAVLELDSGGERVRVTAIGREGPKALVYFGGNAEDVSWSLPELAEAFPEHALFGLHYRGYGGSTGKPSEAALHADALALFDLVHAEHADVTLVGRSLGSGVAVRLASRRPAQPLILVTPNDTQVAVAAAHYPLFPVRLLMRDRFDSAALAPELEVPTLVLAAEHDQVIPRAHTDRLYASFAPGVAEYVVLPGVGHNTISRGAAYHQALRGGL